MQKTYKIISLFILLPVLMFSSCGSRYTAENPYIIENVSPSQETSMLPVQYNHEYSDTTFDDVLDKSFNVVSGIKTHSVSYFWSDKKINYGYTVTTIKINQVLYLSEYTKALNPGDEIKIIEFYSIDPENNYYVISYDEFEFFVYTADFMYSVLPTIMLDGTFEYAPLIKNDTEYIFLFSLQNTVNEDFQLYVNDFQICGVEGFFYKYSAYEATDSAYSTAKAYLSEHPDEVHGYALYYKLLIEAQDKYRSELSDE